MRSIFLISLLLSVLTVLNCSNSGDPEPDAIKKVKEDTTRQGVLLEYTVLPQLTDNTIKESEEPHFAYIDQRVSPKGTLLVFLGGTHSFPRQFQLFPRTASGLGYHVVNINYLNDISSRVCEDETDMKCFANYHEEVIFGNDESDAVKIDSGNSIVNRIIKLLQYLNAGHPSDGWAQYYATNGLLFSKVVFAGHSQGGGHAAYIASKVSVARVVLFCSPNDYSVKYQRVADWCNGELATTTDRFFGLNHKRDEIVSPSEQYAVWKALGMLTGSDTSSADKSTYKNFRALYTNYEPNPEATTLRLKHNMPVVDNVIPAGPEGDQLKKVWKHLLGD